jgi:hypothetical protein
MHHHVVYPEESFPIPNHCSMCQDRFGGYDKVNIEIIPSYNKRYLKVYHICNHCKDRLEK